MQPHLSHQFADALPALALPWQAEPPVRPTLLALNTTLADELGLDADWLATPDGVALLTGAQLPTDAAPVAQAYSGHQFGGFSPRLGDGRALLLGELTTPGGPRDLHLKGSGRTPFARGGDGRAVVGPMLREFLVSEAMAALRIPTTRSLAVVGTGHLVQREQPMPGAVLARVAASHLRVGSFQFARATGDLDLLRALADHAIARHYPQLAAADQPHLALYRQVIAAQAELIADWMAVGFVHGVMNTDNMTVSGETIDYGPCAFVEGYQSDAVFSSIDETGRYAYANQPVIAQWNLARFAEAILPLLDADESTAITRATDALNEFGPAYRAAWLDRMRAKLGISADAPAEQVAELAESLHALLEESRADWTLSFRSLAAAARGDAEPLRARMLDLPGVDAWLERWRSAAPSAELIEATNPLYVPRNHLADAALRAAEAGDLAPFHRLLAAVRAPFAEQDGVDDLAEPGTAEFAAGFRTFCGT
ncbi:protein adenylyltransferase SelO [Nocardioides sp. Bht2]|uniref:protein adenylyltransferase SelO n=1 Tax=Nocardioides sp. Bht2 TaxID=3392297 RepID=UPI0039B3DD06